jgi:hypothetical protein
VQVHGTGRLAAPNPYGRAGPDTFVFHHDNGSGTVTDFQNGVDTFDRAD